MKRSFLDFALVLGMLYEMSDAERVI